MHLTSKTQFLLFRQKEKSEYVAWFLEDFFLIIQRNIGFEYQLKLQARFTIDLVKTVLFFWKMIQTQISEILSKSIFDIVVKLLLLRILVNILSTLIFPPHNGRAKRHSGNNFALLHWNAVKHVWNVFSEINETKDISLRCLLKFEDCFTYCMNNTAWTLGWLIHLYLVFYLSSNQCTNRHV